MKFKLLTMAVLLLATGVASAQDSSSSPASTFGQQTKAWVNLQVSGTESVKSVPPLPGDVATKIYQRWAKSFDYPIPKSFSQSFGSGSSSGTSGSSGR